MQKVITTLKDILTPLCKNRKDIWDTEDWQHIYAGWPPLSREDIDGLFLSLKTESGPLVVDFLKSQRGAVLYLPPLEKDPDCVPILSLCCKLKETQSVAKLRVMLVKLDEKQNQMEFMELDFAWKHLKGLTKMRVYPLIIRT